MKKLFFLVIILNTFSTFASGQIIDKILINGNEISFTNDSNLNCTPDDILEIKSANNKDLKFTLNGKILNTSGNKVILSKLEPGNYLIKIFSLEKDKIDSKPLKLKLAIQERTGGLINWLSIALILVVIILLIILIFNNKKEKVKDSNDKETNELKDSFNRLKTTLKTQKEFNNKLKEDIRNLKNQIDQLEEANLHLIEQKEKLIKQKAKLEMLNKQKDELFAMTVHDIKNPASAIKGLLGLLNDYELNANEQKEIMESLITSSENILKLTQRISETISRTEERETLKKEKSSIKDIIDSVVKVNSAYAKKKGIKIHNKSSSSLPEISFDKEKIEEAIDNLLNNAIKYSKSNTEITVSSYFSENYISVEVSDQGPGLTVEDQKKAFKKGSKLTPKPTGDETSSGLGLWIVKNIIDEHEGRVWIKSKIGVGSKFGFDLPRK